MTGTETQISETQDRSAPHPALMLRAHIYTDDSADYRPELRSMIAALEGAAANGGDPRNFRYETDEVMGVVIQQTPPDPEAAAQAQYAALELPDEGGVLQVIIGAEDARGLIRALEHIAALEGDPELYQETVSGGYVWIAEYSENYDPSRA